MVIKINPNQPALWRDPQTLQIGHGANSLAVGKLSKAQEQLIGLLYRGIANKALPELSKHIGMSASEAEELVERVSPMLLKEPERNPKSAELSPEFVASAFSEIIRASLVNEVDGALVLQERNRRNIHLEDLSKPGLTIALGLAAAGVGHLITHDEAVVSQPDLGPTGYPTQLIGHPRIEALRALLAASPNQSLVSFGKRLQERHLDSVDCAILIAHQSMEPARYARWLNRDVPHLAVTFDSNGVSVSPLIVPGQSPCLLCLEKLRTDQDPAWPVLATQLLKTTKRMDDSASALFAGGIVLQKVLNRIDNFGEFEWQLENRTGYRLDSKTGLVTELVWPQWPECSCGATPEAQGA